MAKKKDKPQIINNIKELNLEIDYDKLAEAIVKANKKSKEANRPVPRIGFWSAVWKTILNKEAKSGKRTAMLLAEIMAAIFNAMAIFGVLFAVVTFIAIVKQVDWSANGWSLGLYGFFTGMLTVTMLLISLIFRAIANEIGAEKDRNYIATLFFGFTSFASLIVALIALFKEVG